MYDAVLQFAEIARQRSTILQDLGLKSKGYLLATVHRPYNTDDPDRLRSILEALAEIGEMVIFPIHPRTRQRMAEFGLSNPQSAICNSWRRWGSGHVDAGAECPAHINRFRQDVEGSIFLRRAMCDVATGDRVG